MAAGRQLMAARGRRVSFLQSCDPWEATHAPVEDSTPAHVLVALTVINEKITQGRKEFAFSQFQATVHRCRKSRKQGLKAAITSLLQLRAEGDTGTLVLSPVLCDSTAPFSVTQSVIHHLEKGTTHRGPVSPNPNSPQ